HAFLPLRACGNRGFVFYRNDPISIDRKRREDQTLFRTGLSPLWVRFPPNASDMQAPGLPPRPGAVAFTRPLPVTPVALVGVPCFISGSILCPTHRMAGDTAHYYLEHQLDPAEDRKCSAARHRMDPRSVVSTRNQDAGRSLSARSIRRARLSSDAGPRN